MKIRNPFRRKPRPQPPASEPRVPQDLHDQARAQLYIAAASNPRLLGLLTEIEQGRSRRERTDALIRDLRD